MWQPEQMPSRTPTMTGCSRRLRMNSYRTKTGWGMTPAACWRFSSSSASLAWASWIFSSRPSRRTSSSAWRAPWVRSSSARASFWRCTSSMRVIFSSSRERLIFSMLSISRIMAWYSRVFSTCMSLFLLFLMRAESSSISMARRFCCSCRWVSFSTMRSRWALLASNLACSSSSWRGADSSS